MTEIEGHYFMQEFIALREKHHDLNIRFLVKLRENNIFNMDLVDVILLSLVGDGTKRNFKDFEDIIKATNLSYRFQKMVRNGYLKSSEDLNDKRSVILTLTDKGKKAKDIIEKTFKQKEDTNNEL